MNHRLRSCMICLSLVLVAACGSYDFTINDRVVYTPDPLFTDFDVPDPALRECMREAINDAKASDASEVSSLSCTEAGIESLAGLSTFTELEQLTLSSNNIVNISELECADRAAGGLPRQQPDHRRGSPLPAARPAPPGPVQ